MVPLSTFLYANPELDEFNYDVIIRPSWGVSITIKSWSICDGSYIDKDNERVVVVNSDVCGYDVNGKKHHGAIMNSSILLPIGILTFETNEIKGFEPNEAFSRQRVLAAIEKLKKIKKNRKYQNIIWKKII